MLNQPLPSNVNIENAVIAGLILDVEVKIKALEISEDCFYTDLNKHIFNAIKVLVTKEKTIDVLTVSDMLKNTFSNALEIISQICSNYYQGNFETYFDKLQEYHERRTYIKSAVKVVEIAHSEHYDNRLDLKNDIMSKFDIDVDVKGQENFESRVIADEVIQEIENRILEKHDGKLNFGFSDIDKITAGFHKGEMTIIGARPGVGKTSFTIQLLINLALRRNKCVLFSREMTKSAIGSRFISNISKIDGQKLRFAKSLTDTDKDELVKAHSIFASMPIMINDEAINVEEMRSFCRKLKNKGELDVIAVDYLGLCRTLQKTQSREREIAVMSWQFKLMAMEFNVPVIVLSQLNRLITQSADREPVLSDLRDSGSIEQDGDNILFLHPTDDETIVKLIIAKQRNGPTGTIRLKHYKNTFRYYSIY